MFTTLSLGDSYHSLHSGEGKAKRGKWLTEEVEDVALLHPHLNVIGYKNGKFTNLEGVETGFPRTQVYKPRGSEQCVKTAMASCNNSDAAYHAVSGLVDYIPYTFVAFESGTFQNLGDGGTINWHFTGELPCHWSQFLDVPLMFYDITPSKFPLWSRRNIQSLVFRLQIKQPCNLRGNVYR